MALKYMAAVKTSLRICSKCKFAFNWYTNGSVNIKSMMYILSLEREQDGYDCIPRHSSLYGNGKSVLRYVNIIPSNIKKSLAYSCSVPFEAFIL